MRSASVARRRPARRLRARRTGDPLYKHWPFLLVRGAEAGACYGMLYDSMAPATFDLGCEHSNYYGRCGPHAALVARARCVLAPRRAPRRKRGQPSASGAGSADTLQALNSVQAGFAAACVCLETKPGAPCPEPPRAVRAGSARTRPLTGTWTTTS